jgi:hypothetical protein
VGGSVCRSDAAIATASCSGGAQTGGEAALSGAAKATCAGSGAAGGGATILLEDLFYDAVKAFRMTPYAIAVHRFIILDEKTIAFFAVK